MGDRIDYENDLTGAFGQAKGSDGRLNVSARADSRAYYNSRDEGETYTLVCDHQSTASGEYVGYLKNTSATHDLVVGRIGVSSVLLGRIKVNVVTGTPSGGGATTPVNLNRRSTNVATCDGYEGASAASGIGGLTASAVLNFRYCPAAEGVTIEFDDCLRLPQNVAIAVENDETAGADTSVTFHFYFEVKR